MDRLRDLRRTLRDRLRPPRRQDAFLPGEDAPEPVDDGSFLVAPGQAKPDPPPATAAPAAKGEPVTPRNTPDGGGSFLPGPETGDAAVPARASVVPSTLWPDLDRPEPTDRTNQTDRADRLGRQEPAPTAAVIGGTEQSNTWGSFLYLTPAPPVPLPAALPSTTRRRSLAELLALPAERVVFLDLETCGLNDVPLFLIGTLRAGQLGLYLARRTSEEPAAIAAAAELLASADALVTFNGAQFDVPYLQRRAARFQIPLPLPPLHVDLLPIARRAYGKRFGNCRLQTLEREVCGLTRSGEDVPSAEVPRVYERYQQTGDERLIAPVLEHNAMDLVTSAHLLVRLAQD
jgi:uncharacterized protein YprB with RNaseH-like and TPR domain